MNDFFKAFFLILITLLIGAGAFFAIDAATGKKVYSGTDIKFSTDTNHYMIIVSDSVQIEAASSDFFVLRKLSGETIVPQPATPPLGWEQDTYYSTAPTLIPGGKWYVSDGDPRVQLTSASPISVTVFMTSQSKLILGFLIIVVGVLIWVLVFGLVLDLIS